MKTNMTNPSINVTQAPPQTPRAFDNKREGINSNVSSIMKANLTPSYSFGLGFLPSFQFNSPRNLNLLNSLSPQRFFQVSNNLNKVVNKQATERNIFTNTPSRFDNNTPNKFLSSLSSMTSASPKKNETEDSTTEEMFSVNEDSQNVTNLTVYDDQATPKRTRTRSISESEFLTPNKLFLKKRRISVTESPNTTMASKIETIASPPKSLRSSSITSLSKFDDDKSWSPELDDILLSSYLKYKAFKKNNQSSILKNVSQNKVISRMVYNKTKILKTTKQIASRLFKLTKDQKDFTSPSLNDEIDELIQTPLEALISGSTNYSKSDTINSAEINAQIDKELDLIFTPDFESNISNFKININDCELSYKANSYKHDFIRLKDVNNKAELKSSHILTKELNLYSSKLHQSLLSRFESNSVPIFQIKNTLNLKMQGNQDFSSLDSIISNINPLDYNNGDISSYVQISINNLGFNRTTVNWNCNSRIFKNGSLIFESDDTVFGILNNDTNNIDATVPFLKNFFKGFLSLLINGNDPNLANEIKVVQIISDQMEPELCLIHEFNSLDQPGSSNFQLIKSADLFGDDLRAILEENEERTDHIDDTDSNATSNEDSSPVKAVEEEDDDNATVIADSSPIRGSDSPKRQFRIDLTSARNFPFTHNGPATAPIFNSSLVTSQTQQSFQNPQLANHSLSTSNLNNFSSYGSDKLSSTPEVISPFNSFHYDTMATKSYSFSANTPASSIVTSTPAKSSDNLNSINSMNMPMNPSVMMQFNQGNQQPQLMVNLGTGYVPFNSLPPALQEKYIDVQKQFQIQQQQQQQQQQRMMYYQQSMNSQIPMGQMMNQGRVLQNIPMNQYHTLNSAPASQTTFAFNQKKNKENPKSIKFGPMLAYNPSKSKDQPKMKEKKTNEPMMGVIHMPNIQLSNYRPPKRKSSN